MRLTILVPLRIRDLLAALVAAFALAAPAAAQSSAGGWPFTVGERVRLYSAPGDVLRAEGIVEQMDWDRVVLSLSDGGRDEVRPQPNDLIAIRRPTPRGERVRTGALWGAFLGASVGAISGPFAAAGPESLTAGEGVALGAAAGGLLGAAAGAAIGAVVRHHHWERFRLTR